MVMISIAAAELRARQLAQDFTPKAQDGKKSVNKKTSGPSSTPRVASAPDTPTR